MMENRVSRLAILAIVLLTFGLRLFRLDYQSLWVDEATSAYLTTLSPLQIVLNRADNMHPPAYFLALAGWMALAGRSEFSVRFFSIWSGLLLVPLLYHVGRLLFADARTGLLAALFAALNPAGVIYSQEARVYAMLPVAYLIVLGCVLGPKRLHDWRAWLLLAASELVCLYLHFFSILIVLAVNVLLLATGLWCARPRVWLRWGTSQALVGLLYAPWLLVVWRWGANVPAHLSRREWQAAGPNLAEFARQFWAFIHSGLVGIERVDAMTRCLGILAGLTLLAVILSLLFDDRRKTLLGVVGLTILPLLGAYPVWVMRPLAHPRYLLFLLAPLSLVIARSLAVLSRQPVTWVVSAALALTVIATDLIGLRTAFFDTRFYRFDMRTLAAAVAERAEPGEAVIMPSADYSLWYYDPAPAEPVNLPGEIGVAGGQLRPQELEPLLTSRPGAFWVTYRDLRTADSRGQTPFLLETNGHLAERFSVDRMDVDHYELEQNWTLPQPTPIAARCEPLMLSGVYSQAVASADNAVTVALRWRLLQPVMTDHKVVVRLWWDEDRPLASADVLLLNELGHPTRFWQAGEEAINYYVLPLPMGTPPLTYTLSVAVYEASSGHILTWQAGEEWLTLGSVRLLRSVGQTYDPYGSWSGADWRAPVVPQVADGLLLEAYTVRPAVLKPGDTLYVTLRWRATRDGMAHYAPGLALRQGAAVLAQDPGSLFERYPTERWAAGELLIETRQLPVPPTLDPLQLAVAVGERALPVGEVSVTHDALQWEVPAAAQPACARLGDVAELVGYDWEPLPEQPDTWRLTLYWRALAGSPPAESYTVFTHLLSPEGVLLAQHDGLPGEGKRPTTTWLSGEIIADHHELLLSEPYAAPARLLVGMYNLATMECLPAYDCAGRRLPTDAIPMAEMVLEETP